MYGELHLLTFMDENVLSTVFCYLSLVDKILCQCCSQRSVPTTVGHPELCRSRGLSSTGAGFHTGGWRLVAPRSSISLGAIANLNTTQDSNSPV